MTYFKVVITALLLSCSAFAGSKSLTYDPFSGVFSTSVPLIFTGTLTTGSGGVIHATDASISGTATIALGGTGGTLGSAAFTSSTSYATAAQGAKANAAIPSTGGTLTGAITGTGTTGVYITLPQTTGAYPPTPATGVTLFSGSLGRLSWTGTNGFNRTFDATSLTASRVWSVPDYDGTFSTLSGAETLTNKSLASPIVTSTNSGSVNEVVKQIAAQTADMTQWQNSAGTVLARVDSSGAFSGVKNFSNFEFFDDFDHGVSSGNIMGWSYNGAGGNARVGLTNALAGNYPGSVSLDTGTTTFSEAHLVTGNFNGSTGGANWQVTPTAGSVMQVRFRNAVSTGSAKIMMFNTSVNPAWNNLLAVGYGLAITGSTPRWTATTVTGTTALIQPTTTGTNLRYRCTVSGTTGGTEPSWPTVSGSTVSDGGVTWIAEDLSGTGKFQFFMQKSSTTPNNQLIKQSTISVDTAWHVFRATYDGSTLSCGIDGETPIPMSGANSLASYASFPYLSTRTEAAVSASLEVDYFYFLMPNVR